MEHRQTRITFSRNKRVELPKRSDRNKNEIIGDGVMEKAFWGMVAGCALAFGVLLTIYLNKAGVIDLSSEPETETVETSVTQPTHTIDQEELYALVYGEDWTEEDIVPNEDTEEEVEEIIYTYEEELEKSGYVEPDRNNGLTDYAQESSESEQDNEETSETPESKSNSEYQYELYSDHVVITKYLGNKCFVCPPTPNVRLI